MIEDFKALPEERHNIVRAFPQLPDFLVSHWGAQLLHGGDNVRSKSLDVYSVVVSLLTDQVHVQHLCDLGSHPVAPGDEERQ